MIGKWANLHWYCTGCEKDVLHYCEIPTGASADKEHANLDTRGAQLEAMMTRLENKMEVMIQKNEQAAKTYAQAVGRATDSQVLPPQGQPQGLKPALERQAVHILDEFVDRERRKANVIVHNLPESTEENLPDKRRDDIRRIEDIILNW